jgi:LysM repeat protein
MTATPNPAPQPNIDVPRQTDQPGNPVRLQQPIVTQPVNTGEAENPNPNPSPRPHTHVVARGETAMAICRKFGVRLNDLETANPGMNPSRLSVGEVLNIP